MSSLVIVHDAIHANISHLPAGPTAGYTTGTDGSHGTVDIRWRDTDWQHHPAAIRICQDPGATDHTADVLDVENFAATNSVAAAWYRATLANYTKATRPGQRHPAIYTSADNVTPLVNALIAGGVHSGPGLWIAKWDFSKVDDIAAISNASGPFPIIGGQFANGLFYDTSVFSAAWRDAVSVLPSQPSTGPTRHVLAHGQTLAEVAAARNTTVAHLRDVTRSALTERDINQGGIYYTSRP